VLAMERANQDIAGDGGSRCGSAVTWGGGVGYVLPTVRPVDGQVQSARSHRAPKFLQSRSMVGLVWSFSLLLLVRLRPNSPRSI
jgi:hypothetical protein